MKALVLHGPGDFRYEKDWPCPQLKEGRVLLRIKYSGICGSDLPRMMRTGAYHHPLICGHEFVGVVEKTFGESSNFKPGETVAALPLIPCGKCEACKEKEYFHCDTYNFLGSRTDGGFAQYCAVPEENLLKIPDELDLRVYALIEPLLVALHLIRRAGFRKGESALVFGAGAIGLLTALWLKFLKAGKVAVVDIREESLELARKVGLKNALNFHEKQFEASGEFDFCFEASGSNSAFLSAINKAKRKGTIAVVGRGDEDKLIAHNTFESFLRKEITIKGSWGYGTAVEEQLIYRMLRENQANIKNLITSEISLEEGEETIRKMYNKEVFYCKVLFAIP